MIKLKITTKIGFNLHIGSVLNSINNFRHLILQFKKNRKFWGGGGGCKTHF